MKRYNWVFFVLFWGSLPVFGERAAGDTGSPGAGHSGPVYRADPVSLISCLTDEAALNHSENAPSEIPLTEAEIRAFKEAVRKAAQQTETLTADFTQLKHSRYLAKAAESKGRLSFQKPGYVLWKYTSPSSYSILFRDNKLFIDDGGKKKDVNAGKRLEKLNKLIAGSVTGDMFDAPEFIFSFVRAGERIAVRLKTREASLKKYIREMELTFENFAVSEVKMTEPSEDYTRIILKNRVLNGRVDPAVFRL